MMTARKLSHTSKLAVAAVLMLGAGMASSAKAQSVTVNYGALDQLDGAAPASQPANPASYATGSGYPFQTAPAANPYQQPYQPAQPYNAAPTPMAAPAPAVQATPTYVSAPSMRAPAASTQAVSSPTGYNSIMILGSPKMSEEARRTGRLPYSAGTLQYRQQLSGMVASGSGARALPTRTTAPDMSRQVLENNADGLPRRVAAYSRADRPAPTATRSSGPVLETTSDGLPRRISASGQTSGQVLQTTDTGLPRRVATNQSRFHKSDDGLIRRVSAKSGTIGITRDLLVEAGQTPTGLPPVLVIKFQRTEQDLSAADRSGLAPVIAKLKGQVSAFELIGFAADGDDRVARKRSLDRVMAVRHYLIENGIAADRIKIRARGAEPTRSGKLHDQVIVGGA